MRRARVGERAVEFEANEVPVVVVRSISLYSYYAYISSSYLSTL